MYLVQNCDRAEYRQRKHVIFTNFNDISNIGYI